MGSFTSNHNFLWHCKPVMILLLVSVYISKVTRGKNQAKSYLFLILNFSAITKVEEIACGSWNERLIHQALKTQNL